MHSSHHPRTPRSPWLDLQIRASLYVGFGRRRDFALDWTMCLCALGQDVCDDRVRMAVSQAVLRLEPRNHLHVLQALETLRDVQPVLNGLAVFLLDGREVRGGPLEVFVG